MKFSLKQIQKLTSSVVVLAILFGLGAFTAKHYQPFAEASPNDVLATTAAVNGTVYAVEVTATKIYIGGDFTEVGGQTRNSIAALNLDGTLDTFWNPDIPTAEIPGVVKAIHATDTAIYVGGNFFAVNGATERLYAAAFQIANGSNTGTVLAWDPIADGSVEEITGSGTKIYLGGQFLTIGGVERYNLAAVDSTTGALDTFWNPKMNGSVYDMLVQDSKLYAVGLFTLANDGQATSATRNFAANFNLADGSDVGAVQTWNPNSDNVINAIAYYDDQMYLGGAFNQIGAELIDYAARVNTTDGAVDPSWDPVPDGAIYDIAISDEGNIFLGGAFDNIGGVDHKWVGLVNSTDGAVSVWDPVLRVAVIDTVYALGISDATVAVGGDFGRVNGSDIHANFAQFRFPKVSFTITTSSQAETAGLVSIEVSQDIVSDIDTVFDISVDDASTALPNFGRFTRDYEFSPAGPYTITSGEQTMDVVIDITNDFVAEGDETIIMNLAASDPVFFGTNTTQTHTITEPAPGFTVTPISLDITEGGSTGSYSIVADQIPTAPEGCGVCIAAFQVNVSHDDQVMVDQDSIIFTDDDWETPQTVVVTAVDDEIVEGEHTSIVSHTVESHEDSIVDDVTFNITDNDSASGTSTSGSIRFVNELPHPLGTIININGTLYVITKTASNQLVRRPYTSAMAFLSYDFNSFDKVVPANQADINLKVGEFVPPQDGRVICSDRSPDQGSCYLISYGRKFGFVSDNVFKGLGYGFDHALTGDISFLSKGFNIETASQAHLPGAVINNNGLIQIVSSSGLLGFPSLETFLSWGYDLDMVVQSNSFDASLNQNSVVGPRQAGQIMMSY